MRLSIKDIKVLTAVALLLPLISIAALRFFLRARDQLHVPNDMWE